MVGINCPGHIMKMADTTFFCRNLYKIFSTTIRPITLKLGIDHWALGQIMIYSNSDHSMIFSYLIARSTWDTFC